MNKFFESLTSKSLDWGQQADRFARCQAICQQSSITLEEFAEVLYDLIQKCEIDVNSDKTVFYYKVQDTLIDIMFHKNLLISISTEKTRHSPLSVTSNSSSEQSTESLIPLVPAERTEVAIDATPVEETKEDESEWTTVTSKRTRNLSEIKQSRANIRVALKTYYFFRDEANSPHIEFVTVVRSLPEVVALAKQERWSHAYCLEENRVYDFHRPEKPGVYRCFMLPNEAYMHKFQMWMDMSKGKPQLKDEREYFVMRESSAWKTWEFIGKFTGLAAVRAELKQRLTKSAAWAHAFQPTSRTISNFWLENGSFCQHDCCIRRVLGSFHRNH